MIEWRTYQLIEVRAEEGEGKSLRLVGHAAVFNKKSDLLYGMFREVVLPGAFKDSIKADDIRALWNHDPNFILGRNKSGTLKLSEDDKGLKTEIDLPDTQVARDLYTSIKRGDIDQMSFGFTTLDNKWRKEDGENIRELVKAKLFDVSPVTFPAYPQTDIKARGAEIDELRSYYEGKIKELEPPKAENQLYRLKLLRRRLDLREKAITGGIHG